MYDYVKVISSEQETHITLAYAEPQNGARQIEYACDKRHNLFTKTSTLVTGETKSEHITPQEFAYAFGSAVGVMSRAVPNETISEREKGQ